MECWKVKFTYQTKRPDMTDKSIATAMPNPPFPSYVSGHSTFSGAAATVLGHIIPQKITQFEAMATEALFTAGRYADAMGKTSEAVELFGKLKDKYPASQRVSSGEVDKYLASLGVSK